MKDEEIVGNLSINITKGEKVELDGKEIGTLLVEAKTVGGQGESAVSQTIKSKITDDLQLVNETKTEDTYLSAKKIETQYIPNYGQYVVCNKWHLTFSVFHLHFLSRLQNDTNN